MKHGKKYREKVKTYEKVAVHPVEKGVEIVKSCAFAKFDETVELAMKLNIKANQSIRDTLVFPHQFGKEKRILVFAKGAKADEAREAGATFVGDDDLIEKIKGGWLDFDIAVSTPDLMKEVGKLGQILGRRGLMPNPKTQTVTFDIKAALDELRKGRVEYRADKAGVIHLAVGKVSMEQGKLTENIKTVISVVSRKRPSDVKGTFITSAVISSTMGPGVKLEAETPEEEE